MTENLNKCPECEKIGTYQDSESDKHNLRCCENGDCRVCYFYDVEVTQ